MVDPDSPSGKEYAIPIERARKEAAGGNGGAPAPSGGATAPRVAPLFGVGIPIKQARKPRRRTSPKTQEAQQERPRTEEPQRPVPPRNLLSEAANPDGGLSDIALIGAGGGGVLLLGGLLGAILRRRSR